MDRNAETFTHHTPSGGLQGRPRSEGRREPLRYAWLMPLHASAQVWRVIEQGAAHRTHQRYHTHLFTFLAE